MKIYKGKDIIEDLERKGHNCRFTKERTLLKIYKGKDIIEDLQRKGHY